MESPADLSPLFDSRQQHRYVHLWRTLGRPGNKQNQSTYAGADYAQASGLQQPHQRIFSDIAHSHPLIGSATCTRCGTRRYLSGEQMAELNRLQEERDAAMVSDSATG